MGFWVRSRLGRLKLFRVFRGVIELGSAQDELKGDNLNGRQRSRGLAVAHGGDSS